MPAVFFYGLFMDAKRLERRGIRTAGERMARLENYRPVLGARVTLVRQDGFTTYGMLMQLDALQLEQLYSDASVRAYRPEAVHVLLENGEVAEALCYTLPQPLPQAAPDPDYARELCALATRLGFPASYLAVLDGG